MSPGDASAIWHRTDGLPGPRPLCLSLSVSGLLSKHLVDPKESPHSWSYQKSLLASSPETVDCGQTGEESSATVILGYLQREDRIVNMQRYLQSQWQTAEG